MQGSIIVGSVSNQALDVMREGVEQFDDQLVVITVSRGQDKTHEHPSEADNRMQLEPKILHGFATTDFVVGKASKVTGLFVPFVPDTWQRRLWGAKRHLFVRINSCQHLSQQLKEKNN